MLEGKCLKCGTYRAGWALRNPRHQNCPRCGAGLEITEDGQRVSRGYSPFTAEEYQIKPSPDVSSSRGKQPEGHRPDKHPGS